VRAILHARLLRRSRARAHGFPARTEAGMTLVELMVAISILAIIMSGLALSIGIDYKAVALARARQVAESVANQRLEELRDVDYDTMALSSQPTHSTDVTNPDYYVSTNGLNYDVTGTGQNEALIVDSPDGPVDHLESPITVGTTVVDVYQYVTWVDDPAIAGTQNLKRLTVVVQYHSVPTIGQAKMLRESVVLTPGSVNLPASAVTTSTSSTSTTSTSSTTSTTLAGSACGSFSIAGSSGATIGYTASSTVTITMSLGGCGGNIYANFSNDGGATWGADFAYSSTATTLAWTLVPGDGTKTISGRARSGVAGTPWSLASRSIILDTTAPTMPSSISRTVSCAGSTRTVTLSWSASSDTYLVGYHVYASSDGTTYSLLASTSSLAYTTTNSKNSVVYYKVKAYDSAGNESNATAVISLAKNKCS
jgi:prepilin-type N-terminal cleavage/methylation domain-containing protein